VEGVERLAEGVHRGHRRDAQAVDPVQQRLHVAELDAGHRGQRDLVGQVRGVA
jgi:hypothetical protein